MGIEFRLASGDHLKLEDLLSHAPAGVSGIVLDSKTALRQETVAEAAGEVGVGVFFDPATHRMIAPGFTAATLPYSNRGVLRPALLQERPELQIQLVEQVLAAHPSFATAITPPYFATETLDDHVLNLKLVELAAARTDRPLRPVVLLSTRFAGSAQAAAEDYARRDVAQVELRLTPLGGERESLRKLSTSRATAQALTDAGLQVTLGASGNVGQVFAALGVVEHFSTGIGWAEHVDHSATLKSQQRGGVPPTGVSRSVYLPGLAMSLSTKAAARLLDEPDLRMRVGCRAPGCCRGSLKGPLLDRRKHYLNSKTNEVARLLAAPPPWRPRHERERLAAARDLRLEVTRFYGEDQAPLPTRTLSALIDHIDVTAGGVAAAV